uniref:Uncharacterized protein n=1 Tax=Arundo donax TaxID=35708 RepID=A0A0A9EN85_ARUDO
MGMAALFIVKDGPTTETSLLPPPMDTRTFDHDDNLALNEFYLKTKEI